MNLLRPLKAMVSVSLLAAAFVCSAAEFDARVVKIPDGDTITVISADGQKERIRFLGIDAPESKQEFGQDSKRSLEQILRGCGSQVKIVYKKRDNYGRIVGKVIACGKDVNLEQLKRGMAWAYRNYFRDVAPVDKQYYLAAEENARKNRIGLWSQENPQEPWKWRSERRRNGGR